MATRLKSSICCGSNVVSSSRPNCRLQCHHSGLSYPRTQGRQALMANSPGRVIAARVDLDPLAALGPTCHRHQAEVLPHLFAGHLGLVLVEPAEDATDE